MDTRALLQNWDASAANLMHNYASTANQLMMPGASAPQAMAGPLIGGPGIEFGPGPLTAGLYQNQQPPQDWYGPPQQQQQSDGPRKSRWEMGDDGRLVDPLTGQHKITAPTKAKPRPSTVFGGAYANGGIAPPGKVSLVGERGPEFIVPSGPTAVVPMGQMPTRKDTDGNVRPLTDFNPVNGRASSFDGMPRTNFFMRNAGKTAGTGASVYNDIRQTLAGITPKADARSFGTGGQNFMGPPMPPTLDATTEQPVPMGQMPGIRPSTGMLVPSSMGGVKWQPGEGPGATAPPQRPQGMPFPALPGPAGLPTLPSQAAPFVDTGSAMDRHMSTGLAGSPRRQVGRSANDPMRIAEQMRRRGDPSAILRFGAQQMGQDFAREQNALNFAQNQMQFSQQQQAMDARDARNFDQGLMMFGLQQGAMNARDQQNFQQQQQIEAQRRATEQAAQEQQRRGQGASEVVNVPSNDGKGYVPMIRREDGSLHPAGGFMPNNQPRSDSPAAIEAFRQQADAAGFHAINVPGEGWQLKPKAKPQDEGVLAFNATGELKSFPADYELPPGWQPMKRKAAPAGVTAPQGGGTPPVAKPDGNAFAGKTTSGGFKIK